MRSALRMSLQALTLAACLLLSGCATIFSRMNPGANMVSVNTNTEGANVYNINRKLLGQTPLKVIGTDRNNKVIIIEKEGFESQSVDLKQKDKGLFVFLDVMAFGLPYFVDVATGSISSPEKDKVDVTLKRIHDPKAEFVHAIINEVDWKIKEGTTMGKDGKDLLIYKKTFFNSYIYQTKLCKLLQETRYKTWGCDKITDPDYQPAARGASIYITPQINHIAVSYVKEKRVRKKKLTADITWKFSLDRNEFVIREIQKTASHTDNLMDDKTLLANCLLKAVEQILEDDALFKELKTKVSNTDFSQFNSEIVLEDPGLPRFVKNKDLIKHLMEGVVTVQRPDGAHGSGFFISEDGYLITNYHVVEKQKQVNIRLGKSVTLVGDVIRSNQSYDMALIKIAGKGFVPLQVGNSDSLSVGEDVFAIGTPEDMELGQSVSKGIVSGKRKFDDRVYIQTDVSVNPGNSGGPLLNESGEVMGMVSAKMLGEGLGFCIPTNKIFEVLNISYKK